MHRRRVRDVLAELTFDAIRVNDWMPRPPAVEAARRNGAKIVYAHEYGPLQFENRPLWTLKRRRLIEHVLRTRVPAVDAFVTVCPPLAERYSREFGTGPRAGAASPPPPSIVDRLT